MWMVGPAVIHGVIGTGSSFRVKWYRKYYGKGSISVLQEFFLLVLTKFSLGGGTRCWAIILWGFDLLIFPNFLVLRRSATRKVTSIYQFVTNNHVSFHLWRKENLLNHQKVSKYYELDCTCLSGNVGCCTGFVGVRTRWCHEVTKILLKVARFILIFSANLLSVASWYSPSQIGFWFHELYFHFFLYVVVCFTA